MNEPPNAILRYIDDYLMDDSGNVTTNNDDIVVYNDQSYCYDSLSQQKFCCNKL